MAAGAGGESGVWGADVVLVLSVSSLQSTVRSQRTKDHGSLRIENCVLNILYLTKPGIYKIGLYQWNID